MIEQLITDHLDLWSSAVRPKSSAGRGSNSKLELTGIKKLRELILELAVRGKLVTQDPNDEPASVLLERIAAEKARLVKEGKLKKSKPLPEITDEEKPFELPEGWEWITLSHVGFFYGGKTPSKMNSAFWGGDIPWVTPKDMKSSLITSSEDYVTARAVQDGLAKVEPYSLLLVARSGILRRTIPVAINIVECTVNQDLKVLRPFCNGVVEYLRLMIVGFEKFILSNLTKVGTTVESLMFDEFSRQPFIFPPLEEQHRIVAKVDELMSLCDQLEQKSEASLAAHQTLVEALLATLTDSADSSELAHNWARLAQYFDSLFTTQSSIDALKKTILQLAVMGKLVPQDPNDEPASVLLERIAAEKARLVKEGKIKKEKPLPPISEEEKPFALPDGWEWVRLQSVASKITDGDHKTPARIPSGMRMLSAKNVRDGYVDFDGCDYISEADYEKSRERCLPSAGDLLIVSVGGTIGRSSLVPEDDKFSIVRSVALIKPLLVISGYFKNVFDSKLMQQSIHENKRGGAQPCLYLSEICKFLFPVPPIQEQLRLVQKVDELMSFCDQLSARLQASQTTQLHLAEALVEGALN